MRRELMNDTPLLRRATKASRCQIKSPWRIPSGATTVDGGLLAAKTLVVHRRHKLQP